jgi:hypothetical protein
MHDQYFNQCIIYYVKRNKKFREREGNALGCEIGARGRCLTEKTEFENLVRFFLFITRIYSPRQHGLLFTDAKHAQLFLNPRKRVPRCNATLV